MLSQRPVDLETDQEFVLDLGCMASYESLPAWYRNQSYRAYRDMWYNSTLPKLFLGDLSASLREERTLAEVWLEDNQRAGFLWMTFGDSPHGLVIATLHDLVVEPGHQRRGIGKMMLQAATRYAKRRKAGILRVETSVENPASQAIYAREGFTVARLLYEKVLDGSPE
ncbi:MAG TPA: GNAT family N-acetyltransferase [Dehalococcoidia bacterium]